MGIALSKGQPRTMCVNIVSSGDHEGPEIPCKHHMSRNQICTFRYFYLKPVAIRASTVYFRDNWDASSSVVDSEELFLS